jgi:hypothetical protein
MRFSTSVFLKESVCHRCHQGWKKPGFFYKNPAQWVFLFFFVFFGFFGFFFFLGFLNIFAQNREFLVFFQFKDYF